MQRRNFFQSIVGGAAALLTGGCLRKSEPEKEIVGQLYTDGDSGDRTVLLVDTQTGESFEIPINGTKVYTAKKISEWKIVS